MVKIILKDHDSNNFDGFHYNAKKFTIIEFDDDVRVIKKGVAITIANVGFSRKLRSLFKSLEKEND